MAYLVVRQSEDGYSLHTSDCKLFNSYIAAMDYCAAMNKAANQLACEYEVIDYIIA